MESVVSYEARIKSEFAKNRENIVIILHAPIVNQLSIVQDICHAADLVNLSY